MEASLRWPKKTVGSEREETASVGNPSRHLHWEREDWNKAPRWHENWESRESF